MQDALGELNDIVVGERLAHEAAASPGRAETDSAFVAGRITGAQTGPHRPADWTAPRRRWRRSGRQAVLEVGQLALLSPETRGSRQHTSARQGRRAD